MEAKIRKLPKRMGRPAEKYESQFDQTYKPFNMAPKTMLQVAIETGILRANITRYVARLRREGKIILVAKALCPISKHRGGFYKAGLV